MLPAFRSDKSALGFSGLLVAALFLPVFNAWIGHPPREQSYAAMSTEAGPVDAQVREMFDKSNSADVVILGSSLVRAGVDFPTLTQSLSDHLHRPAQIDVLALNWQGLDLQYFLLRDYLQTHHPSLMLWNLPVPGSRNLEPHIEAFRWVRFGEYGDVIRGLPLHYRVALYADMVLGAPRELLSHLRPNLLNNSELLSPIGSGQLGYYGAPFVRVSSDSIPMPPLADTYENPPYPLIEEAGKPLNEYEKHFAGAIVELARANHVTIAFLHIPIDSEREMKLMPERGKWPQLLHINSEMVGVSSEDMFPNLTQREIEGFYRDQHLNANGRILFTRDITPAVLTAFDATGKR